MLSRLKQTAQYIDMLWLRCSSEINSFVILIGVLTLTFNLTSGSINEVKWKHICRCAGPLKLHKCFYLFFDHLGVARVGC